jgi:hypothetical protein
LNKVFADFVEPTLAILFFLLRPAAAALRVLLISVRFVFDAMGSSGLLQGAKDYQRGKAKSTEWRVKR